MCLTRPQGPRCQGSKYPNARNLPKTVNTTQGIETFQELGGFTTTLWMWGKRGSKDVLHYGMSL